MGRTEGPEEKVTGQLALTLHLHMNHHTVLEVGGQGLSMVVTWQCSLAGEAAEKWLLLFSGAGMSPDSSHRVFSSEGSGAQKECGCHGSHCSRKHEQIEGTLSPQAHTWACAMRRRGNISILPFGRIPGIQWERASRRKDMWNGEQVMGGWSPTPHPCQQGC